MSPSPNSLRCPHCRGQLSRFIIPEETGWNGTYQWACFNDNCPYYRTGWDWMRKQYQVNVSYRYRVVEPETGRASPLAVWSETALRDRIVDGDNEASDGREE